MIRRNRVYNPSIDFLGIAASLLCAIHCAFLPFLLSIAYLSGLHFLANPWIEYSVIALSLAMVLLSLLPAYKKHHHNIYPIFIVFAGFTLILFGQLSAENYEIIFTASGAILVAISHGFNWFYISAHLKKSSSLLK